MNVAFVLWGADRFGGMERRYIRLASKLINSFPEHSIYIFCNDNCFDQVLSFIPIQQKSKIITYVNGPCSNKFIRLNLALVSLRSKLKSKSINHIHLISNPGHLSLYILPFITFIQKKSMVMVDSTYDSNSAWSNTIAGDMSLLFYDSIDCISRQTYELSKRIFKINNLSKFKIAPCSFTESADKIPLKRIDQTEFDFVMIARFVDGKGYDLIEKSFDVLKKYKFKCFGSGPNPPKIPSEFIDYTENPIEVLLKSKIFLSLQPINNYPSQSLLEAALCKTTIIATDVGETRQFLNEDTAVLIVYDSSNLITAIRQLLENEDLRLKLSSAAFYAIKDNHTIERYSDYFKKSILNIK
jgi:glycosyltransferase involved in cell wall biosynthesis